MLLKELNSPFMLFSGFLLNIIVVKPVILPCFACLQVQRKQKGIVNVRNDLEEFDDRIHAMSEHLKNVRQELHHTQVSENNLFLYRE